MNIIFDDDERRRIKRRRRASERRLNRPWTRLTQSVYTLGYWYRRCRRYFALRRVRQSERQRRAERIQDFYDRIVGLFKILSVVVWYTMALFLIYLIFSDVLPSPVTIASSITSIYNFLTT